MYNCQCNSPCERYGDCCADYQPVCVSGGGSTEPALSSCQNRCGDKEDYDYNCQCNSYCTKYGDCCDDYSAQCSSSGGNSGGSSGGSSGGEQGVTTQEILDASDQLWLLDENRASTSDIIWNKQASTSDSSTTDKCSQPFFSYVNPSLLEKDTYKQLMALRDNYNRVQGNDDTFTPEEIAEQDAWIDMFVQTKVGEYLFNFLSAKGYAGAGDLAAFKAYVKGIWFGLYVRDGTTDTSGFEHVFVGEIDGNKVSGYHNWVSIYLEEQLGNLDYYGYTGFSEPNLWGLHFYWYGKMKGLSGSIVGVSPEYEMAVMTLCHVLKPDSQCSVQVRDENGVAKTMKIQTWTWSKTYPSSGGKYVASAYFLA